MIDIRGAIIAVTICFIIALAADVSPKPLPQNAPYCSQPVWNQFGDQIGARYVPCVNLDRYEQA